MFRVHFVKLHKNDLKGTIRFKAPTNLFQKNWPLLKELVTCNMLYITAIKCILPTKKLGKSRVLQE